MTADPTPERCENEAPGPLGKGLHCYKPIGHDGPHGNTIFNWAAARPPELMTTEDRYWQAEAHRARAERDALALRLLQMADSWEAAWGGTRIVADVAAEAIRAAVESAGGH